MVTLEIITVVYYVAHSFKIYNQADYDFLDTILLYKAPNFILTARKIVNTFGKEVLSL